MLQIEFFPKDAIKEIVDKSYKANPNNKGLIRYPKQIEGNKSIFLSDEPFKGKRVERSTQCL